MSMQMCIFHAGSPPTPQVIDRELAGLGTKLRIADPSHALDTYGGFMPMLHGEDDDVEDTGVEVYCENSRVAIEEFDLDNIDPGFDRQITFRWGGDMMECACATSLAMVIAKLTDGVIYDEQEGRLVGLDEVASWARSSLADAEKERQ